MNMAPKFVDELDECAADAALYVLGALSPEMTSAFEQRLRSGCPYCATQAAQLSSVADQLSMAVSPVKPRPELRRRLLDRIERIGKAPESSHHMRIVRKDDARWVKMPSAGVEIRQLIGNQTLMVRMQPGAVFPEHDHPKAEQCYVLEGSITDSDGVTLNAGDFVVMSSGIQHAPLHTETGCTLLIAYTE
jgi:gentisate 1,2-dioxygenase